MVNAFRLWIWINAHSIALPELSADTIENVRLGYYQINPSRFKMHNEPIGTIKSISNGDPMVQKI